MGQSHDAHRSGAVVVGAVIDALRPAAVVIEVAAEDDGLGLQRRVAAFDQSGDVVGIGAAPFRRRGLQVDRDARRRRTMPEPACCRWLSGHRRLLAGGGEQRIGDRCGNRERRDAGAALRQCFRRNSRALRGLLSAPAAPGRAAAERPALRPFVVRIGHGQDRDGAVLPRIRQLVVGIVVAGVAFPVEDRIGVGLLRLVVEDQDDLALWRRCPRSRRNSAPGP